MIASPEKLIRPRMATMYAGSLPHSQATGLHISERNELAVSLIEDHKITENLVTGVDSNLEHIYPLTTRPAGYVRDSLSTRPSIDFVLRVLEMVPLGTGHLDIVAESFNLLNHRNVSLLNTAFGPKYTPQSGFSRPIATFTPSRIKSSLEYEL